MRTEVEPESTTKSRPLSRIDMQPSSYSGAATGDDEQAEWAKQEQQVRYDAIYYTYSMTYIDA